MVYICVSVRDGEDRVGLLLWKVRRVMDGFGRDYRILVHDDGSQDGTPRVLERYARVLPVTILRVPEPEGYGRGLERLVREAVDRATYPRRDVAVTLRGDFSDSPEGIEALVKRIEGGADVVAAAPAGNGRPPVPLRLARRCLPLVFRGLYRSSPVADPLGGFRAYRIVALERALERAGEGRLLRRDGWAANAELLLAVAPHARRVEEVTVPVRYDLATPPSWLGSLAFVRDLRGLGRDARRRGRGGRPS